MQRRLFSAGWTFLSIDGVVGPNTTTAIKQFQSTHGLTAVGLVGLNTWLELRKY